jgi:hypothetical protein
MGWHPVDLVTIRRDSKTQEIVVSWSDAMLGDKEKRFPADTHYPKDANKEAFECARLAISELCM